jgi:acylphosphatase
MKRLLCTLGVIVGLAFPARAAECLVAYLQAGGETAKPAVPEKTAQPPSYTRYYIHAIGERSLVVHSCLTATQFTVKTDDKTVVIRLDGKAGSLGDLKVGQWVKFRREGGQDDPENRIARIEVVAEPAKPVAKTANQRREVFFSGHVQGVGFRQATAGLARRFAVSGFVKNLPDGRVQLVAEGQAKEIDAFVAAIRQERAEYIKKTEEKTSPASGEFQGFGIRY